MNGCVLYLGDYICSIGFFGQFVRIDGGPEKVFGESVYGYPLLSGIGVGVTPCVAELELFVGEFAVYIQDFLVSRSWNCRKGIRSRLRTTSGRTSLPGLFWSVWHLSCRLLSGP